MRDKRGAVHADNVRDGVPVLVLVLLPVEDEGPVLPAEEALRRLLRPLLLRAVRPLPGIPRAQAPRLRHGNWLDLSISLSKLILKDALTISTSIVI